MVSLPFSSLPPQPPPQYLLTISRTGTWQTRAGFSLDPSPRVVCPPLVSRYRDRKALKTYTVCGYDVYADPNARGQARTPFDSNVVSNFDQMETLLDYCFIKLGVGDGQGVGHPLVMTEAVCNPGYSRRSMASTSSSFLPPCLYVVRVLNCWASDDGTTVRRV